MFYGSYDFIINETTTHELGIEYLDFTLGDETYKYKLGGKETQINNYIF